MTKQFTFIDLFSGIGGFRMGLEACGGKCVFSCEKDKYAVETYRANFDCENHVIHNDITQLKGSEIPKYDVLSAGFPCQSFSILAVGTGRYLNRKTGLDVDGKGALFFDLARIIGETKPKAFILENVKNLLNHDKGNTFKIIKNILENDLGYHIQYRVINSKHFVPQARERVFIIGFREKNDFDFDKIELPLNEYVLKDVFEKEEESIKYTISDKLFECYKRKHNKFIERGYKSNFALRYLDPNKKCFTLCCVCGYDGNMLIKQDNKNPRHLTPLECSKLMGFNELNKNNFKMNHCKTRAYRQYGNAVVPQVVEWIGREIIKFI